MSCLDIALKLVIFQQKKNLFFSFLNTVLETDLEIVTETPLKLVIFQQKMKKKILTFFIRFLEIVLEIISEIALKLVIFNNNKIVFFRFLNTNSEIDLEIVSETAFIINFKAVSETNSKSVSKTVFKNEKNIFFAEKSLILNQY